VLGSVDVGVGVGVHRAVGSRPEGDEVGEGGSGEDRSADGEDRGQGPDGVPLLQQDDRGLGLGGEAMDV
jgi:hypothetical protein